MMKSVKARRAAKVFLWIGIVTLLVTAYVGFLHFCATGSNAPFEMRNANLQKLVDSYSLEALMIAGGVTLILFLIALICAGVARSRAKRENAFCYCEAEEEYFEEPELEVSVTLPACKESKKNGKASVKELKAKITDTVKNEKVQKVGKIVLPVIAGCIVTAAIASAVQSKSKAKNRRQFYKWLG